MTQTTRTTSTIETLKQIQQLRRSGTTDLLVSVSWRTHQPEWGDVKVLPRTEMEQQHGVQTDMMTAEEFEQHFPLGKLSDFPSRAEAAAAGYVILVEDPRFTDGTPDVFMTVEEMQWYYTELHGHQDFPYTRLH